MMVLIGKTVLIYIVINFAIRMMGKRQVGELSTSEIVVALLISEVAASSVSDPSVPLQNGMVAVLVLVGLEIAYSFLSMKFPFFMNLTQGKPIIIYENGQILEKELLRTRLSIAEFNEELRMKNINLRDVYMAIIENNGQLSIIPTNEASGVTRRDLGISVRESPQDFAIIIDGRILDKNLERIGRDAHYVEQLLRERGVSSAGEVLALYADREGITFFQKKQSFSKSIPGRQRDEFSK